MNQPIEMDSTPEQGMPAPAKSAKRPMPPKLRAALIGLALGAALAGGPVLVARQEHEQAMARLAQSQYGYESLIALLRADKTRREEKAAQDAAKAAELARRAALGLPPPLEGHDKTTAAIAASARASAQDLGRRLDALQPKAMERLRIYQEAMGGKDPDTIAPSGYKAPGSR